MTTFEIEYIITGSGKKKRTDKIWLNTGDERKNGSKVKNITDAIEYFEEITENWGTYENRNAIVNIKTIESKHR